MALLIRTADPAAFVHSADPDADATMRPQWWPAADPWLPALGQPVGATRVVVRAMSTHERTAVAAVWDGLAPDAAAATIDEAAAESTRLLWECVLSVGDAPVDPSEVDPGLRVAISRLISQVTAGAYGPLGRS